MFTPDHNKDISLERFHLPDGRQHDPHFILKQNGKEVLVVSLRQDSYLVSWPTDVKIASFFEHACKLIDQLAGKNLPPRTILGDNNAVATIAPGVRTTIAPSYSGFEPNSIFVPVVDNILILPFDRIRWPIEIANLEKIAAEDGVGPTTLIDPFEDFLRINAPYCTLMTNQDRFGKDISFWSHVLPSSDLLDFYKNTANYAVPDEDFLRVVKGLVDVYVPQETTSSRSH